MHYATFAAFWLALGHALLVGTDLKGFGGPLTAILAAAPVLWLSFYRLLTPRPAPPRRPAAAALPASPPFGPSPLDNPVRLEAARQAAADARRKAQAYAEGLGATLGQLVRLSEPGEQHRVFATAARAARREQLPVEPGEHEVTASIEATFLLEPGTAE